MPCFSSCISMLNLILLLFFLGGSTKLTPAVVGGSIAGFLFVIIALFLAIKWQKNRSCSGK